MSTAFSTILHRLQNQIDEVVGGESREPVSRRDSVSRSSSSSSTSSTSSSRSESRNSHYVRKADISTPEAFKPLQHEGHHAVGAATSLGNAVSLDEKPRPISGVHVAEVRVIEQKPKPKYVMAVPPRRKPVPSLLAPLAPSPNLLKSNPAMFKDDELARLAMPIILNDMV